MTRLAFARCVLMAVTLALLVPAISHRALGADKTMWGWPLEPTPTVVHIFDPPDTPYGPGHRGIDLAGSIGQSVLAIGSGTVTFAGTVAGRGVVVVDHGRLSSTYQPVAARVAAGEVVAAGDRVGTLQLVRSHCLPAACLHLGVKAGETYLDPLTLMPDRRIRLQPLLGLGAGKGGSTAEDPREPQDQRVEPLPPGASGAVFGLMLGDGLGDRPPGAARW